MLDHYTLYAVQTPQPQNNALKDIFEWRATAQYYITVLGSFVWICIVIFHFKYSCMLQ